MRKAFQNYLAEIFKDPTVDKFQTRNRRRALSVGLVLWLMVTAFCMTLIGQDLVWPVFVCAVIMVYLMGMHNMSTRGVFELSDEHLDEFQIQSRNQAYKVSFGYSLIWLLLLSVAVLGLEPSRDTRFLLVGLFFFAFTSGLSAPRLVYAWTAPDESEEDDCGA